MKHIFLLILCIIMPQQCCSYDFSLFKTSLHKISSFFYDMAIYFKPKYYEKSGQKEIPAQGISTFIIANAQGPVTLTGWKKESLHLASTTYSKDSHSLQKIRLSISKKSPDTLVLTTHGPQASKWNIAYDLLIPQDIAVIVTTESSPITVYDSCAAVTTATHSGNIFINSCKGTVHATSKKGSIDIQNTLGDITTHSSSGKITIQYDTTIPSGTITATTTDKNITVTMPKGVNSSLICTTQQGTITSEHDIMLDPKNTKLNTKAWSFMKKNISGMLGAERGETSISLKSHYGNISLLLPTEKIE